MKAAMKEAMKAAMRKGWCPGALAPMRSGDGFIFRLRLTHGALSFERAKIFADLSRRFGNGAFDLSARANLQLRGVAEADVAALQAELAALGLLDADPRIEAARNLIPSPLAGHDPSAALDARPLVEELERLIAAHADFARLPPKFGFAIDGGGFLPLDVQPDVVLAAVAPDRLTVTLGGVVAGEIAPREFSATVLGVVAKFLALRQDDRRLAATVARLGVAALAPGLGASAGSSAAERTLAPTPDAKILGAHPLGAKAFVGAGLLFGRISAEELEFLAEAAEQAGAAELRLTPWRAILAVGLDPDHAEALAGLLAARHFLLDAEESRRAFIACPGAPACSSALGDARALALRLAPSWAAGRGKIHVSACEKGCAFPHSAPTFVTRGEQADFIADGLAHDAPDLRNLDFAAMQAQLQKLVEDRAS